jgi:hypothetical protein
MNRLGKNLQPVSPEANPARAYEKNGNLAEVNDNTCNASSLVRTPSPKPSKPYWTRRRDYIRQRCIKRLKPAQVEGMFAADDYAARCGHRLNIFITIKWVLSALLQKQFGDARKRMREWLAHRGVEFYWLYVHENPPAGFNTHMLVHVPPKLQADFMAAAAGFFGFDNADFAFDIKHRYGPREKAIRYMCKGTDWATAVRHGIHDGRRWKGAQGDVPFKRCGCSQNIGPKARTSPVKKTGENQS